MAYFDLWAAYAHACARFNVHPGPAPGTSTPGPFSLRGADSSSDSARNAPGSLTRTFLENSGAADGLGWFAELGQRIVQDIIERNGLCGRVPTRSVEAPFDFQAYFKGRRLRP
ncbi:MAG TPA: hypothetical protein PKX87_00675 [Alphaproteobacteria bacterium]|nr:hypothetical protein [Alphaproteobacteria bacterium]